MSGRALIVMDLRNAARNLASWRRQTDSTFVRDRIAYWRQQCDLLLDQLMAYGRQRP